MNPVYERRFLGWPIMLLFVLAGAVSCAVNWSPDSGPWRWIVPPAALLLGLALGTVTIVVDREKLGLRATFGWPRRSVPLARIASVHVVEGMLLRAGLGLKWALGNWRWNVTGNRGVLLVTTDGRTLLIGTPEPEELVRSLERIRRPGGLAPGE